MAELPKVVEELRELIGLPSALKLVERHGGTRIYVPASPGDDHWLVKLLGQQVANQLARYCGRDVLVVPRCAALLRQERDSEIRRQHAAGASARALALSYQVTDRTIWRILAHDPASTDEPRQRSLF